MESINCSMTKREFRICIIALDGLILDASCKDDFVPELAAKFVVLHNKLDKGENDDDRKH